MADATFTRPDLTAFCRLDSLGLVVVGQRLEPDRFHVVRLAGDALDESRRRVQQRTCGHRGRSGDPLHGARRTLHTGADLLTDK
jgi:Transposase